MAPAERILGASLAALGLIAAGAALTIGDAWGPRMVPLLAAAALAASGVAIAAAPPATRAARPGGGERRALSLLVLGVLTVLAVERVGFLAAALVATPAAFVLFGARRPVPLLIAAVAVPLALHLLFFRLLGVFPPLGRRFDLLDHLPL